MSISWQRAVRSILATGLLLTGGSLSAWAEGDQPAATDPAKADGDFAIQGEYVGQFSLGDGVDQKFGMQMIAQGEGKFHLVAYIGGLPGDGWDGFTKLEADGEMKDGAVEVMANEGTAIVKDGVVTVRAADGNQLGTLSKTERKSESEGAKPPEGAMVLFDGSSVDQFTGAALGPDGVMTVASRAGILSKAKFKDFTLHLEFRTPYMPTARGQARGNSGVYLQHRYEVQVLDSFGLEGLEDECGGFYSIKAPDTNMCFPPLSWQTYDIEFTAARWGDVVEKDKDGKDVIENGQPKKVFKKIENARVTVKHNGVVIHDNVELNKATPGGVGEEDSPGPLFLQHHGNPVVYRNVWVVEKK